MGSIGVIMEGLNFHDILRQYNIKPLVLKAGASKNPITSLGPVNKDDIENEQKHLSRIHDAFKELVVSGRPQLMDIVNVRDDICDGSVYLGNEAKELKLVDEVMTTDEYILNRIFEGDRVLMLHRSNQSRMGKRFYSLTPLDILPHLVKKGTKTITTALNKGWWSLSKQQPQPQQPQFLSLVQTGTVLRFAQYLYQKYLSVKTK